MVKLLDGLGSQNSNDYIKLLMAEPGLSGKLALLIEDLLYLGLKEGVYISKSFYLVLFCQIYFMIYV